MICLDFERHKVDEVCDEGVQTPLVELLPGERQTIPTRFSVKFVLQNNIANSVNPCFLGSNPNPQF